MKKSAQKSARKVAKKAVAKKAAAKFAPAKAAKKTTAKPIPAKKAAAKTASPSPAQAPVADWTLLVYMAGDNDLDSFGGKDIKEMKAVGSSDRVHVIVQRDSAKVEGASRLRVRKGTSVKSDVVQTLGRTNTGDPKVLEDFLNWGLQTYPARRTMAVLWNHGSGWDDTDIYEEARRQKLNPIKPAPAGRTAASRRAAAASTGARSVGGMADGRADAGFSGAGFSPGFSAGGSDRGSMQHSRRPRTRAPFFLTSWIVETVDNQRRAIAFDDDAQDFIDSVEMKNIFEKVTAKAGRPFDVIGMDACLMSMVETGLQVAGSGTVMCGSQEIEPGDGWPYDRILEALDARPTMDGVALSTLIAKEFVASYPKSQAVTQSAVTLGGMQAVADAANALGALLAADFDQRNNTANPAVRRALAFAREECQGYDHPDYVDLWDFAAKLAEEHPPYATACAGVQRAVEACVFANHAPNSLVRNSHGLSIYLPQRKEVSPLYQRLDFGRGGWAAFLQNRAYVS